MERASGKRREAECFTVRKNMIEVIIAIQLYQEDTIFAHQRA